MSTKVQLIGGNFQDSEGNLLVNGYLTMRLNQDERVNGNTQVGSGVVITIQLDSVGNVASSASTPPAPNQFVWGNDQLTPTNSFYRVTGYKSNGQIAWGPNNQQVIGNGGTFDVGTWVPNSILSWTPALSILLLETNGTPNGSQTLLNLADGPGVTVIDNGSGTVSFGLAPVSLNTQTASYTAVLADANNIVLMDVSGANNFTIPTNASEAFPVGTTITVIQEGAGQTTLVASGGVTLFTPASLTTRAQYSTVSVIKLATNTWVAAGDLT